MFDVEYETAAGEGKRSKITFISWVPDDAPQYVSPPYPTYPHPNVIMGWCAFADDSVSVQPRMMYSSSKDALKRALNGLAADIQANDPDDIEHDSVVQRVSKGR